MEVLAAGSSIAGLLSLAGQCIAGAQKLTGLYQDITTASKSVESFLRDLNSLLRTLDDAQALLRNIQEKTPHAFDGVQTTTLKLQLEDCNDDLSSWLRTAQSSQLAAGQGTKGTRAWFRTFWTAVNKDKVKSVRTEMQRRRSEIAIALSALGRNFDLQIALATESIEREVRETNERSVAIMETSITVQRTLEYLETLSLSISDSIGSMNSLRSSYSAHSSSHESMSSEASDRTGGLGYNDMTTLGFACNEWKDDDALFCSQRSLVDGTSVRQCSLCGHAFIEPPQWDVRMHHMRMSHKLGQCAQAKKTTSLHVFHDHLKWAHNADIGYWTQTYVTACQWNTSQTYHTSLNAGQPAGPAAQCSDQVEGTDEENESEHLHLDDNDYDTGSDDLLRSSWDTALLAEWSSGRDRINRWILHSLGSDIRQRQLHQRTYAEATAASGDMEPGTSPAWSRLILKYWFIDEAAIEPKTAEITAGTTEDAENIQEITSSVRALSLITSSTTRHSTVADLKASGGQCLNHPTKQDIAHLRGRNRTSNGVVRGRLRGFDMTPRNLCDYQSLLDGTRTTNSKVTSSKTKYECKICGKGFDLPRSLQTHMYAHTGEKPFACAFKGCDRHFSVISNLRRHRMVHTYETEGTD